MEWYNHLMVHMTALEKDTQIVAWSDKSIPPGNNWRDAIADALAHAKVGIILVSANLFASDFARKTELPALLSAAKSEGTKVLSLIISASRFGTSELESIQAQNSPETALQALKDENKNNQIEQILVDLTYTVEDILKRP